MSKTIYVLVVCGPTASGKTKLAVDLAKRFGGEIIGADSMQVYKGMSIGTAKPSAEETREVPHHLIDFLEPDSAFSVAEYVRLAKQVIKDVAGRGRLPVLAGGTGLYINSLLDNISFENIEADEGLRAKLKSLAEEKGGAFLHEMLAGRDPELAEKLHPNNTGRIIRALEVCELTGVPMSEHMRRARQNPSEYDACMLGLRYSDRGALYERIDRRVDLMLEQGLIEEAKSLFDAGFTGTASQAIGYKELFGYFSGKEPLSEAVENIKRETRRYAKRQMTWFKRDGRIRWFDVDKYEGYDDLLAAAAKIFTGGGL